MEMHSNYTSEVQSNDSETEMFQKEDINKIGGAKNNPQKLTRLYNSIVESLRKNMHQVDFYNDPSKNCPMRSLTGNVIWFIICSNYYPDSILQQINKGDVKNIMQTLQNQLKIMKDKNESFEELENLFLDIFQQKQSIVQKNLQSIENNQKIYQEQISTEQIYQQQKIEEIYQESNEIHERQITNNHINGTYNEIIKKNCNNIYSDIFNQFNTENIDNIIQMSSQYLTQLKQSIGLSFEHLLQKLKKEKQSIQNSDVMQEIVDIDNKDIECLVDLRMGLTQRELYYLEYLELKHQQINKHENKKENPEKEPADAHVHHVEQKLPDEITCHVCNDGEYTDENLIVICSQCNVSVHQECYGIVNVPSEDWICQLCLTFGSKGQHIRCPFCPCKGGAIKPSLLKSANALSTKLFLNSNPSYHNFLKRCNSLKDPIQDIQKFKSTDDSINGENQKEHKLLYDFTKTQNQQTDFNMDIDEHEPFPAQVWCHLSCTYWMPELYFDDKDWYGFSLLNFNQQQIYNHLCNMYLKIYSNIIQKNNQTIMKIQTIHQFINSQSKIKGIETVDKKRFQLQCSSCKQRKVGAAVQCQKGKCTFAFHPECARRGNFFMEIKDEGASLKYNIFCSKHQPLKLRRTYETNERHAKEEINKFCHSLEKYLDNQKKIERKERQIRQQKQQKIYQIDMMIENSDFIKQLTDYYLSHQETKLSIELLKTELGFKFLNIRLPMEKHTRLKLNISQHDKIWNNFNYGKMTSKMIYKKYRNYVQYIQLKNANSKNKFIQKNNQNSQDEISKKLQLAKRRKLQRDKERKKFKYLSQLDDDFENEPQIVIEDPNLYCLCQQQYIEGQEMLGCEGCDDWFHYDCVGFVGTIQDAQKLEFYCHKCEKTQNEYEVMERRQVFKHMFKVGYPPFNQQVQQNQQNRLSNYKIQDNNSYNHQSNNQNIELNEKLQQQQQIEKQDINQIQQQENFDLQDNQENQYEQQEKQFKSEDETKISDDYVIKKNKSNNKRIICDDDDDNNNNNNNVDKQEIHMNFKLNENKQNAKKLNQNEKKINDKKNKEKLLTDKKKESSDKKNKKDSQFHASIHNMKKVIGPPLVKKIKKDENQKINNIDEEYDLNQKKITNFFQIKSNQQNKSPIKQNKTKNQS